MTKVGKEEGELQNVEYLENERGFPVEKKVLLIFLRTSAGEITKISRHIL